MLLKCLCCLLNGEYSKHEALNRILFIHYPFLFFLSRRVDIVDEVDEALDVVKDKSKI